jgi:thiol-disulfide isomerase/thioredoxin
LSIKGSILIFFLLLSVPLWAAYETEEPVDFTLEKLGGGQQSLATLRGKWVVLNYWATWCAPCLKEIPDLSQLHDSRADIIVLGLAFEENEIKAFEEFLLEFKPSYPILLVDVYNPPEPFGAPRVLPTTIVLDPTGKAVKAFLGPVKAEDIEGYIDSAATE